MILLWLTREANFIAVMGYWSTDKVSWCQKSHLIAVSGDSTVGLQSLAKPSLTLTDVYLFHFINQMCLLIDSQWPWAAHNYNKKNAIITSANNNNRQKQWTQQGWSSPFPKALVKG